MEHSIGEIAVEVPGGTEHCLIPIRLAPIGVCARVAFTRIRLDLGNSNGHSAVVICALKQAAEDFGCDVEHLAGEEPSVRQMKSIQLVHLINVSAPGEQRLNEALSSISEFDLQQVRRNTYSEGHRKLYCNTGGWGVSEILCKWFGVMSQLWG